MSKNVDKAEDARILGKYNKLETAIVNLEKEVKKESDHDFNSMALENRSIGECLADNVRYQLKWESLYNQAQELCYETETWVDELFSRAFSNLLRNEDREWSTTEAKTMAVCDEQYLKFRRLFNKAKKIRNTTQSMIETCNTRKFILKDLSALIINGGEKYILGF